MVLPGFSLPPVLLDLQVVAGLDSCPEILAHTEVSAKPCRKDQGRSLFPPRAQGGCRCAARARLSPRRACRVLCAHRLEELHMKDLSWMHRRIDPFFAPYLLCPVSHSLPLSLSKWCLIVIGGRGRTWRGVQLLPMTPALVTASDVQAYLSLARPYSSPNRRSRMRTSTTKASAPIA